MGVEATLIGLVIGAVLTGASSLVLAQRGERREARVGVSQLLDALTAAGDLIDTVLEEPAKATWWAPRDSPSTAAWDRYHSALIVQLPTRVTGTLAAAVQTLQDVASLVQIANDDLTDKEGRYREARQRLEEAHAQAGARNPVDSVLKDGDEQTTLAALQPDRRIDASDQQTLLTARNTITAAHETLDEYSKRSWWTNARQAVPALMVFTVVVAALIAQPWQWFSDSVSDLLQ